MAYMSQQNKKELAPRIQAVCKKYGVKATIAVRHMSVLVLNIKSGRLDLIGQYNEARRKYYERKGKDMTNLQDQTHCDISYAWARDTFSGECQEFAKEIHAAMNVGNHDRSDTMTDYFDVGWYVDINVGQYDKPYILEA